MMSIVKLNKTDNKFQFVQTEMWDLNNHIVCQRPSEANRLLKPCKTKKSNYFIGKHFHTQTEKPLNNSKTDNELILNFYIFEKLIQTDPVYIHNLIAEGSTRDKSKTK